MPADIREAFSLHQALLQRIGGPPGVCGACGQLTESLQCPVCRLARHRHCVENAPMEDLNVAIQEIKDSPGIQECFELLEHSSSPVAEDCFCDWCSAALL